MRSVFPKNQYGVNFVELMIVILILGIVMSIASPTFGSLIIKSRISLATSTLHSALSFARVEAIKRGRNVVICRSSNPGAVTPSCTTTVGADWGQGWIIYVDQDGDKKFNNSDQIVQVQHAIFSQEVDGSITASPHRNYLSFNATGQTFGSYIRFTIHRPKHDSNSLHDKFICIASGGRARVDNETCNSR
nr:GspH/FimT family pseudopilin [uncultured Undibacterium sp.]